MRKFEIVCNAGSLSASGGAGPDIKVYEIVEDHEGESEARNNFNSNPMYRMYGREIKSIREVPYV
jgi:hypothetical protein